jgi:crotonobetainyl-CoA:carnitine CoA-transferase CaiB-like acyl-CoA transferase
MGYWLAYTQAYDEVPEPLGAGHPNWSPYDVFETADDTWVFVGPSSERQWRAFCDALDLSLHEDERFETLADRREHREELTAAVADAVAAYPAEEVIARLREAGVPVAPVNDTRAVCEDTHLRETDAFASVTTAEGREAEVDVPRFPVRSTGFDRIESENPPRLGEDTDAVLDALGYDDAEIETLRERDAI